MFLTKSMRLIGFRETNMLIFNAEMSIVQRLISRTNDHKQTVERQTKTTYAHKITINQICFDGHTS